MSIVCFGLVWFVHILPSNSFIYMFIASHINDLKYFLTYYFASLSMYLFSHIQQINPIPRSKKPNQIEDKQHSLSDKMFTILLLKRITMTHECFLWSRMKLHSALSPVAGVNMAFSTGRHWVWCPHYMQQSGVLGIVLNISLFAISGASDKRACIKQKQRLTDVIST